MPPFQEFFLVRNFFSPFLLAGIIYPLGERVRSSIPPSTSDLHRFHVAKYSLLRFFFNGPAFAVYLGHERYGFFWRWSRNPHPGAMSILTIKGTLPPLRNPAFPIDRIDPQVFTWSPRLLPPPRPLLYFSGPPLRDDFVASPLSVVFFSIELCICDVFPLFACCCSVANTFLSRDLLNLAVRAVESEIPLSQLYLGKVNFISY